MPLALLVPIQPSAAADCGSAGCTVTFQYTGSLQSWPVPAGVTTVRFDVQGAAGGGGALGGRVTGVLRNLPSVLYIGVGGAGTLGNRATGGYNGGASSGASAGDSGSGGGASDIRGAASWIERLVVAGGAGGQGSGGKGLDGQFLAGNLGGAGGGLVGLQGVAGSDLPGGRPGTQTSGGLESDPEVTGGGVAGQKRDGGVGGSAGGPTPALGGGGGGGGYYGGGGGGVVDDKRGSGSGGGGGSGYASNLVTDSVVFASGVRSGNGIVTLTYGAIPTLVSFSGKQTSANQAIVDVDFGAPVSGLGVEDFSLASGSGCRLGELSGGPSLYQLELIECTKGNSTLTLRAGAALADEPGPQQASTIALSLSIGAPVFSLSGNPTNSSTGNFNFDIEHASNLMPLGMDDFNFEGCRPRTIAATAQGSRLNFIDCADGLVQITLRPNSLQDAFGNSGPAQAVTKSIRVDASRPSIRLENLSPSQDAEGFEQARIRLLASESVSVRVASLSVTPSAGCHLASSGSGSERIFTVGGCETGNYTLTLPIGVVSDSAGWLAPTSAMRWSFTVSDGKDSTAPVVPTPSPNPSSGQTDWPVPSPQQAPWIPIDMTTEAELDSMGPITDVDKPEIQILDGAAGSGSLEEADLSGWLIPAGLMFGLLITAWLLLRRRKTQASAEDDGAASVKKHSVFGKPADCLG